MKCWAVTREQSRRSTNDASARIVHYYISPVHLLNVMITALFTGLAVGLIHVFSGPDHLSAIAPIACVEQRRVWIVGLRWGLGHSLGVVIVGLCAGIMAHWVAIEPFSASCEWLVGVMLLVIGTWGLWRMTRMTRIATKPFTTVADIAHTHADGSTHHHASHPAIAFNAPFTASKTSVSTRHRLAPYAIGILHGCAGGSHLVGILLMLAFPTIAGVMSYLVGFVAGSILAMCAFAAGIGWLATVRGVSSGFQRGFVAVTSCATIAVGCWWLVG